jgi:hypothetical protein
VIFNLNRQLFHVLLSKNLIRIIRKLDVRLLHWVVEPNIYKMKNVRRVGKIWVILGICMQKYWLGEVLISILWNS